MLPKQGVTAIVRLHQQPADARRYDRSANMSDTAETPTKPGLRVLKKQRTREQIVNVAHELFDRYGYREITIAQIAEAAEVAPSTLQRYFPAKSDIVFAVHDLSRESVAKRIVERPPDELAIDAIIAWVADALVSEGQPYAEALKHIPAVIASDAELVAAERLRVALFEDLLASAFARDLNEPANGIRAHALGTIAHRALRPIWIVWFQPSGGATDNQPDAELSNVLPNLRAILETAVTITAALPSTPS
jgi:AcrR family transcriptional regulator